MDTDSKLLWVRLRTTRSQTAAGWIASHELQFFTHLESRPTDGTTPPQLAESERWSPVFVVGDTNVLTRFSPRVTGQMWLLSDTKPVELAARLQNRISPDTPHALFLTHGMASVVLLLKESDPQLSPLSLLPNRVSLCAVEEWDLVDGHIRKSVVHQDVTSSANSPESPVPHPSLPELLPHSVMRQIQDNGLVFGQSLALCKRYRPSHLNGAIQVQRRSLRTIQNIEAAAAENPIPWQSLLSDAYSLGHLNSMMAYFVSQGLSGHPPLLENHGLVPSYSLFGVATAYQGTWGITHFIEDGFLRFDILSAMSNSYYNTTSVDYSSDLFKPSLDSAKPHPATAEQKSPGHVNLFSGRLGFHSSTWAIAAPVESLHEASHPGWNLLTLSHELLHVHVDRLLEFVLSPHPEREPSLTLEELYVSMAQLGRENASRTNLLIIDRIRQKIARYILHCGGCRKQDTAWPSQLPRVQGMPMAKVTDAAQFRDMLVAFWRRMTEYIVHVLDFYYFYSGNVDRFLSLVLPSWASIPSVYDDIGHYIMRCLLTVSTREMDPDTGTSLVKPLNFEQSLRLFQRSLGRQTSSPQCMHLIAEMRGFAKNPENKDFLRWEFERAMPLVWTTVMYFYCRPLRLYFEVGRDVTGGMLDEGALCPEFEFGAVKETLPISPIAFLSKYLSGDYVQPDGSGDVPTEAAAIWLFSWIASCGPP